MSYLIEMGASLCIEWDSRRRNRRDLEKVGKMQRITTIRSNSAFWPLLDAIGIYSWSSGCLPIIPVEMGMSFRIEWDSRRRNQRDLKNPKRSPGLWPNGVLDLQNFVLRW